MILPSPLFHPRSLLFALSFFLTLAALLAGERIVGARYFPESVLATRKEEYFERLKRSIPLDGNFLIRRQDASRGKQQHLFWASDVKGEGFSVDLLKSPALVESLFPGYAEELRADSPFWNRYFQLDFGPYAFLLSQPGFSQAGFTVAYSWAGCLLLYEKFGADAIVMGSSEVYQGLVPQDLAARLVPSLGKSPKVLFCTNISMPPQTVLQTLAHLSRLPSPRKPRMILWGYSFWLAFVRSEKLKERQLGQAAEYQKYLALRQSWEEEERSPFKRAVNALKNLKLGDLFPKITWDSLASLSVESLSRARATAEMLRAERQEREDLELPKEILERTDAELGQYLDRALAPSYFLLEGAEAQDCLASGAKLMLDKILDEARRISPNIFIYLVPTTRFQRNAGPSCLYPAARSLLAGEAQEGRIHLLDGDPKLYGLTDRDFIDPIMDPTLARFDINHTNFGGSLKTTRTVAGWINESLK